MPRAYEKLEARRQVLQAELDCRRSPSERNRKGQFATPPALAQEIVHWAKGRLGSSESVRFIDPALGTGAFYSSLLRVFPKDQISVACGYEIDPYYGRPALDLWKSTGLETRIEDFMYAKPPEESQRFNLLICNPPYVRHHHIERTLKQQLKKRAFEACGVQLNGLSGLYCYFLGVCHEWLAPRGLAGWLVPSEFMDVNYGVPIKKHLLSKVNFLQVHRFDPCEVQFGDALVSSSIVWFRNEHPSQQDRILFTYGGSLSSPRKSRFLSRSELARHSKWTRYPNQGSHATLPVVTLSSLFTIKRGLVTGSNSFFILTQGEVDRRELPMQAFRPILPSPRFLPEDEVRADDFGHPVLDKKLFLLDCDLLENEVKAEYPALWEYLQEGQRNGVKDGYLCQRRKPWYRQENRPPTSLLCTYLGRSDGVGGKPFRFILNHSSATAANVYLMLYPNPGMARAFDGNPALLRKMWEMLNRINAESVLGEGRVYGGGLHKLEPRELGNLAADEILESLELRHGMVSAVQGGLFDQPW